MYICYNVWFMTKLFFKNPIFVVWVAFCLAYLFFKPNMYIFYLLFMIMIPFKTWYRFFCNTICIHLFFTYGTSLMLSHIFLTRIPVFMILIMYCFYTMSGFFYFTTYISFKARYRLFVTQEIHTPPEVATTQRKGVYLHIYYLHVLQNSMMISSNLMLGPGSSQARYRIYVTQ